MEETTNDQVKKETIDSAKKIKQSKEKEKTTGKKDFEIKVKKGEQDWLQADGQLVVDVYETASEFCIQAPIAGVNPEDIEVSVEGGMLNIGGERKYSEETKEKNYFYRECYWGAFSRQILLPEDADASRIKASLKKGILLIKIPKVTKPTKKKVNVSFDE